MTARRAHADWANEHERVLVDGKARATARRHMNEPRAIEKNSVKKSQHMANNNNTESEYEWQRKRRVQERQRVRMTERKKRTNDE